MKTKKAFFNLIKLFRSTWFSWSGITIAITIMIEATLHLIDIQKLSGSLISGILGSLIPVIIVYFISEYYFERYYLKEINHLKSSLRNQVDILQLVSEHLSDKTKRKPSIFISYINDDKDIAHKFIKDLSETKIQTFTYENSINIGDNISEKLDIILKESDYFIFLISKGWKKSKYFENELNFAIKHNKKIFPVLIDEDTKLPSELDKVKYAKSYHNYYLGLEDLMKSLNEELETKAAVNKGIAASGAGQ